MTLEVLRRRLQTRLRPVSDWRIDAPCLASDHDLNPGLAPAVGPGRAAAVLVPVIARAGGPTLLLTRRADSLRSHTGQIAFPGGRLDPGETAVDAALREAWEEVALAPAAVEVLGLGDPYRTVTGFAVTPVVGWITPPVQYRPSPAEVAEVFETPWDFLMNPANHRRDFFDPPGEERRWFWTQPWQGRYIWGATAGMIRGLWARLYGQAAEDAA